MAPWAPSRHLWAAFGAMGTTEARPALPLLRRAPLVVKAEIGLTCVRIISAPGTSNTSATLGTVKSVYIYLLKSIYISLSIIPIVINTYAVSKYTLQTLIVLNILTIKPL
ncbi:hypothetical protein K504DRAFT_452205 [Pleomassaria siparia CBS 279.74]|uniref:Uncharacterized protein n=1 Tax=Pleomassaria siparia CBS 279.74 TaxID=1314801 RepID=A0A6G1KHI6_9PLEO|nr:hypothetical protein K504DRAFT_452205 [Pleomassaria siparia CBS 279.74]